MPAVNLLWITDFEFRTSGNTWLVLGIPVGHVRLQNLRVTDSMLRTSGGTRVLPVGSPTSVSDFKNIWLALGFLLDTYRVYVSPTASIGNS